MPTNDDSSKRLQETHSEQARKTKGTTKHASPRGIVCPQCKTSNPFGAQYCEECGFRLANGNPCAQCGNDVEVGASICESCGARLESAVCPHCGNDIAPNETFCGECGKELRSVACPNCGKSGSSDFCQHCSTPLSTTAKQAAKQGRVQKEKDTFARLAEDVRTLRARSEPDSGQSEAGRKLEREQMQVLGQILNSAASERSQRTTPLKSKKQPALFSKKEGELMQKKAELRRMMEMQSKKTFKTPKEARAYFHAVRPPNALGWVCNYKNTIHPSPDGCAHPEHGGHWEMFTDIQWFSTTEDV